MIITIVAVAISLIFINACCRHQSNNYKDSMFYNAKNVEIKECLINSKHSSVFLIYSVLGETMYYSPGISIVSKKDNLPFEIVVCRADIKEKKQLCEYISYFGKDFKTLFSGNEILKSKILDYDYVVKIPIKSKNNQHKRLRFDANYIIKLDNFKYHINQK